MRVLKQVFLKSKTVAKHWLSSTRSMEFPVSVYTWSDLFPRTTMTRARKVNRCTPRLRQEVQGQPRGTQGACNQLWEEGHVKEGGGEGSRRVAEEEVEERR